jgi:hypothetical protein
MGCAICFAQHKYKTVPGLALIKIQRRRRLLFHTADGRIQHVARVGVGEEIRCHRVLPDLRVHLIIELGGIGGAAIHQSGDSRGVKAANHDTVDWFWRVGEWH